MAFIEGFKMFSKNSIWNIGCLNHVYTVDDFYYRSPNQTVHGMTAQ